MTTISPLRAKTSPFAPTEFFLVIRQEMRAVIAGLDDIPEHEIRTLAALFMHGADRTRRRQKLSSP